MENIFEGDRSGSRIEHDSMGPVSVPEDAFYGASTQRAVENFPISDLRLPRSFIEALAIIKLAAAEANAELGLIDPNVANAIAEAAREVMDGHFDDHFPVDVFQTGSGTSTNMNANEVIAARAREIMRGNRFDKALVHPNDHVNRSQSSNDVIPTATHIAAVREIDQRLLPALTRLARSLSAKSRQFKNVIKTGRTHLQDATPVTLGQEFGGYAAQVRGAISLVRQARNRLTRVALGGTAVGTGINAHPQFAAKTLERASLLSKARLTEARNHMAAQSAMDEVVFASGALKTLAVALMKVANDIRFLGSGPRAGYGEITLPEVQPGSSIMPGKVNPVIAESVLMVAARVIGNDATITVAGQSGNFELNVMQPIAAYCLLESIAILAAASDNFRERLIDGVKATGRGPRLVEEGLALATSLTPEIGYDRAAEIAHEAATTGETIREAALRLTTLGEKRIDELLDPFAMTSNKAGRRSHRRGRQRRS